MKSENRISKEVARALALKASTMCYFVSVIVEDESTNQNKSLISPIKSKQITNQSNQIKTNHQSNKF